MTRANDTNSGVEEKLYSMECFGWMAAPGGWDVSRVPGGWIWSMGRELIVFVPYNNEFQGRNPA